uniref:Enoyl reductase (ER) domain-containing protein n=1 Tax=Panagrolaimus sp. PS1159 TaxID=55785 RepID=A0AC35GWJ4_9BILA
MSIPKIQKAQVCTSLRVDPIYRTDFPVPEPKAHELLVHVLFSGVCHSDVSIVTGDIPMADYIPLPVIVGHEGAGIVAKLGENVKGFKEGDRVGIMMTLESCFECESCKTSNEHYCDKLKLAAIHSHGTFQEYSVVSATHAHKLPDGIDLAKAAPLHCAGVTVYRALKQSGVRAGEIVAISGAGGGLGSFAIQFAKAMGMQVLAIDMGTTKEEHCKKLGADFFVDACNSELIKHIIEITKGGPHGMINVATATKPIEDAMLYVRKRGTIVAVGLPKNPNFNANSYVLVQRGITLKGSFIGNRKDMDEVIQFFARGLIDVPIEIHGLSELPKLLKRLQKNEVQGRLVVDTSK